MASKLTAFASAVTWITGWTSWFEDLIIQHEANGETLLTWFACPTRRLCLAR